MSQNYKEMITKGTGQTHHSIFVDLRKRKAHTCTSYTQSSHDSLRPSSSLVPIPGPASWKGYRRQRLRRGLRW